MYAYVWYLLYLMKNILKCHFILLSTTHTNEIKVSKYRYFNNIYGISYFILFYKGKKNNVGHYPLKGFHDPNLHPLSPVTS